MVHKWLEEWYDTLLYLGLMLGSLFFFIIYWNGAYQVRYTEVVLQEFLSKVATQGKVTAGMYEELLVNLDRINAEYDLNIICTEYELQPVYDRISKENLFNYYMERNVRKEAVLQHQEIEVKEETAELLCLQSETNATIMAAGQQSYLPLPEEEMIWNIEAVRSYQEVYEGEALITLCLVSSKEGQYYAEALPAIATISGIVWLQLLINEETVQVPVEVVCHPRKVTCNNGHEIVNSKNIVEESRKTGNVKCPFCAVIPEYIAGNVSVVQKMTGAELTKEDIWILVKYLDGHTEQVTPDSEEWQDTYDRNYCGIQQVTILYRGKEDTVIVVSENPNCQQCQKACNERCYEDYLAFPYCIACMADVALFTGEVYEEEHNILKGELVSRLDAEQELILAAGDFVTVYVSSDGEYVTLQQREVLKDGRVEENE